MPIGGWCVTDHRCNRKRVAMLDPSSGQLRLEFGMAIFGKRDGVHLEPEPGTIVQARATMTSHLECNSKPFVEGTVSFVAICRPAAEMILAG